MFSFQILSFLLVVLLVNPIKPYSNGAPDVACDKMFPGHGFDAQSNDELPVTLVVLPEGPIAPGETVTITLEAHENEKEFLNEGFEGFLIQARRVNSVKQSADDREKELLTPLGFFSTREAIPRNCSEGIHNAITHRNRKKKKSVSSKWVAPEDYEGEIYFKYTVVVDYYTYWVGVETSRISVTRDSVNTTTDIY